MVPDEQVKMSTKERILESAGELFAEKGFKETTVRDICERAEANVAAVNYHFGDKERLWEELQAVMLREIRGSYIENLVDDVTLSLEERLTQLFFNFLYHRLDPSRPEWKTVIFHHALMQPGSSLITVLEEMIEREQMILWSIVSELLGPVATTERFPWYVQSILGQVFFYFHLHGPHFQHFVRTHGLQSRDSGILKRLQAIGVGSPVTEEEMHGYARHAAEFAIAACHEIRRKAESPESAERGQS